MLEVPITVVDFLAHLESKSKVGKRCFKTVWILTTRVHTSSLPYVQARSGKIWPFENNGRFGGVFPEKEVSHSTFHGKKPS